MSPLASTDHQDRRALEVSRPSPSLQRPIQHFFPERISGNLEASPAGEGGFRVSGADGSHEGGTPGVHAPGNDVLLEEDRGDPGLSRGEEARKRSVAPQPKSNVEAFLEEGASFSGSSRHLQGIAEPISEAFPW